MSFSSENNLQEWSHHSLQKGIARKSHRHKGENYGVPVSVKDLAPGLMKNGLAPREIKTAIYVWMIKKKSHTNRLVPCTNQLHCSTFEHLIPES